MDTPGLQNRQSLVNIRSVHWCVVVPRTGQETIRALTILDELSLNMYFHSFHLYFSSRTRAKCCILSTKRGACNMSITYKFTVYIKVLLKWKQMSSLYKTDTHVHPQEIHFSIQVFSPHCSSKHPTDTQSVVFFQLLFFY